MTSDTEGRLCIGFVLDESSSMGSVYQATISGFNEYVNGLRKQDGETSMTVSKFSSLNGPMIRPLCENEAIDKVPELSMDNYRPSGNTPLYDAVGTTIKKIEGWLSGQTEEWPVLFIIQTDGYENASREFTRAQVFQLIEAKQAEGWKFIYLGADQDAMQAEQAARGMGMGVGQTMGYASASTGSTYSSLTNTSRSLRVNSAQSSAELAEQLKKTHEEEEAKKAKKEPTPLSTPNF